MQITFYQFGKRENSTYQPTVSTPARTISGVRLKEACSISAPVLVLNWTNQAMPHAYDYAYILDFNRYYFVTGWVCVSMTEWEASLSVDVLASFKTQIGAERHYILRAATTAYVNEGVSVHVTDGKLIDTLYPTKADFTYDIDDITTGFATSFSAGTFILGIINNASAAGAVTYYAMNATQLGAFKSFMLGDPANYMPSLAAVAQGIWDLDINEPTVKALFNPFQYVVSALWFPFTTAELHISGSGGTGTYVTSISCGWWDVPVEAYAAFDLATVVKLAYTSKVTAHPQAVVPETTVTNSNFRYLNYPPFSRYFIQLPPFGNLELDGNMVGNYLEGDSEKSVSFQLTVDLITGQAYLYTVDDNTSADPDLTHLIEVNTQLAIPIQLGQITSNAGAAYASAWDSATSVAGHLISTAGGNAMGAANAIGSMSHGILDAISASSPRLSTMGTQGGLAAFTAPCYILSQHFKRVETDPFETGYPVCKNELISHLGGYILCRNADPQIAGATMEEKIKIRDYLNGGFFYA